LLLLRLLLLRDMELGSPCKTLPARDLLQQVPPAPLPPDAAQICPQLILAHGRQTPASHHLLLLLMTLLLLQLLVSLRLHA
jgi:hypothetical protein